MSYNFMSVCCFLLALLNHHSVYLSSHFSDLSIAIGLFCLFFSLIGQQPQPFHHPVSMSQKENTYKNLIKVLKLDIIQLMMQIKRRRAKYFNWWCIHAQYSLRVWILIIEISSWEKVYRNQITDHHKRQDLLWLFHVSTIVFPISSTLIFHQLQYIVAQQTFM